MEDFPTPEVLFERYKRESNGGEGLSDTEVAIINQPYYSGQNTNTPRYYQRNAINKTLDAVARGQERILLVMATGTGKTFTAFQIVYRLLKNNYELVKRMNLINTTSQAVWKFQAIQQNN